MSRYIFYIPNSTIQYNINYSPNHSLSRFLPKFKKQRLKTKAVKKAKKVYNPFPPEPTPRREDLLMETGEYFLSDKDKQARDAKRKQV